MKSNINKRFRKCTLSTGQARWPMERRLLILTCPLYDNLFRIRISLMIRWWFLIFKSNINSHIFHRILGQISKSQSKWSQLSICLKFQDERDITDHREFLWDTVAEGCYELFTICHYLAKLSFNVCEFFFVILEDTSWILGFQPVQIRLWLITFWTIIELI